MKIIKYFATGACLSALTAAACGVAFAEDAVPSKVVTTCQSCHGPAGHSVSQAVPRLNGQSAGYIVAQFRDFHDPGRQDPHATAAMWAMVRSVDAPTLAGLAAYYARQTPTHARDDGPLAEAGRKLFENGDRGERIAACRSCHGASGEGHDANPRLAGQHAEYLKNQLIRLRFGLRASGAMHPTTNSMTDGQIDALVAYLAGN